MLSNYGHFSIQQYVSCSHLRWLLKKIPLVGSFFPPIHLLQNSLHFMIYHDLGHLFIPLITISIIISFDSIDRLNMKRNEIPSKCMPRIWVLLSVCEHFSMPKRCRVMFLFTPLLLYFYTYQVETSEDKEKTHTHTHTTRYSLISKYLNPSARMQ